MDVVAALTEHAHNGVCMLDAPGLNADVQSTDSDNVLQAIWLKSDTGLVRLSVSLPSDRSGWSSGRSRSRQLNDRLRHLKRGPVVNFECPYPA